MSRPFQVYLPLEQRYLRHSLFAIELPDAVTLPAISRGIKVADEGLYGKPTRNSGGVFDDHGVTWRDAPTTSHTNADCDFVSMLCFGANDAPYLNVSKELTVQLWDARRSDERAPLCCSADLLLPQARMSDRSTDSWADVRAN